jgi:uncharacterized repeat protein (TIGR01451 family)
VTDATVSDTFPAALLTPAWTCVADAGSSCGTPSGAGNIATTVSLEPGDDATFTVTATIASGATGLLVNSVTVAPPAGAVDGNTANNTASSSFTLTPIVDLQVGKSGPASAVAGTNVVYTITVTNAGPSDAAGVSLADAMPAGLTFVSNAGDCTTAFPCDLGTIVAGVTRTITATFAIPSGYTTPDPIVNTATVSSATVDQASDNNSATAATSIAAPVTDLDVIIGADPTPAVRALAGERIVVRGYVTDPHEVLTRARVHVVPMRVGAGIKLRLIDSMAAGLPFVTTTVGAEGLPLTGLRSVMVADAPMEIARRALRLYRDRALWTDVQQALRDIAAARYSRAALRRELVDALAVVGLAPSGDAAA